MAHGNVDIFTSRRNNFVVCEFWLPLDEDDPNKTTYDIGADSDGFFYGKEISPETDEYQVVGGDFLFSQSTLTLETSDDISVLVVNAFAKYDGEDWRVKNVQRIKKQKQSQFSKQISYTYYVTLRK